jgi:hypothetical protein
MKRQDRGYSEDRVVADLSRKGDILIPRGSREIRILWGQGSKGDVGIKSRGKIDFLVKNHGYVKIWTRHN